MIIDGVNPGNGYGLQKLQREDEESAEVSQQISGSEVEEPQEVTTEQPDEEEQGVLRLLQERHFKGVADIRLRINFQDELAAIEAEQLKNVVSDEINGVFEAVNAGAELLSQISGTAEGEGENIATLQEQFTQAVTEARDEFLASEEPSKDDLIAGIQAAFEAFVAGLLELYPPAEEEVTESNEGEEEANIEESGQEEEGDAARYIAELESSFAAAMEGLSNVISGVYVLPELSQPSGNGTAYEKFLAIYNEMNVEEQPGLSAEV